MNTDTPETNRIEKEACDNTGALCRPDILWDALENMELKNNELRQMVRELRDALQVLSDHAHSDDCNFLNFANSKCNCGIDEAEQLITKATKLLP